MRLVLLAVAIILVFTVLLACTGCGKDNSETPDSGAFPACPAGVEGSSGANPLACTNHDTSCLSSPSGYVCSCLCGRYWECDAVVAICTYDGGA